MSNKENLRNGPQIPLSYPYSQSRLPRSTDKMKKKGNVIHLYIMMSLQNMLTFHAIVHTLNFKISFITYHIRLTYFPISKHLLPPSCPGAHLKRVQIKPLKVSKDIVRVQI